MGKQHSISHTVHQRSRLSRFSLPQVYYVGMSNEQPPRLRPDAVFLYDSKTRVFTAPPIHREREQLVEPTLRILRDGTVRVEEGSLMPPPGMVADMVSSLNI